MIRADFSADVRARPRKRAAVSCGTFHLDIDWRGFALGCCLLVSVLLLAACSQPLFGGPEEISDATPPALAPLFVFLTSAPAGEVGIVEDPSTGASVQVVAGRDYHAASGRRCRPFQVLSAEGYEGITDGLACRDDAGHWTVSEHLINPDDLTAPRMPLPAGDAQ